MLKKTFVFLTCCSLAITLSAQGQKKGAFSEILGGDAEAAKQKPQYSYLYNTSLIKAITDNDSDRISFMLYAGVDTNQKNDEGLSPLAAAAGVKPDAEITEMLIKHGAKVNEQDAKGVTPLMIAARNGRKDVIDILLRYGANPNIKDAEGRNVLDYASEGKHHHIVLQLMNSSIIKIEDKENAMAVSVTAAAGAEDFATVKRLVAKGADINSANRLGFTPLIEAVDTGNYKLVKDILSLNPNLEMQDNTGRTALMHSIQNGSNNITRLLLQSGANPQTQDNLDITPLILAAKNGNGIFVKEMLALGANVNSQDRLGRTPLSWSIENNDLPLFGTLMSINGTNTNLSYGKDKTTPLIGATKQGNYTMAEELLKKGADVNAVDNLNNAALYYAVSANDTKIAMLLIAYDANPYYKNDDMAKLSDIAKANNNLKLVQLLDEQELAFEKEEELRRELEEKAKKAKEQEEAAFWDNIEDIDGYISDLEKRLKKAKSVKAERQSKTQKTAVKPATSKNGRTAPKAVKANKRNS